MDVLNDAISWWGMGSALCILKELEKRNLKKEYYDNTLSHAFSRIFEFHGGMYFINDFYLLLIELIKYGASFSVEHRESLRQMHICKRERFFDVAKQTLLEFCNRNSLSVLSFFNNQSLGINVRPRNYVVNLMKELLYIYDVFEIDAVIKDDL
jgi:hypothetical protein